MFSLILQVVTLVSGVASVTGFEGANSYATSADAVLGSVTTQLIEHSEKITNGTTASAEGSVDIDATALVTAAETAANVTLGESLAAALAGSTAATAKYVANATATSVATASSSSNALTTIATLGVVGQKNGDPAVDALLKEARAEGSSNLASFPAAARLLLARLLMDASSPKALKEQTETVNVPTPEQAPSPSPPPPSLMPPPPPPPGCHRPSRR